MLPPPHVNALTILTLACLPGLAGQIGEDGACARHMKANREKTRPPSHQGWCARCMSPVVMTVGTIGMAVAQEAVVARRQTSTSVWRSMPPIRMAMASSARLSWRVTPPPGSAGSTAIAARP